MLRTMICFHAFACVCVLRCVVYVCFVWILVGGYCPPPKSELFPLLLCILKFFPQIANHQIFLWGITLLLLYSQRNTNKIASLNVAFWMECFDGGGNFRSKFRCYRKPISNWGKIFYDLMVMQFFPFANSAECFIWMAEHRHVFLHIAGIFIK